MRCVQCGSLKDKVLDSRMSKDGTSIRRRRMCLECEYRYTTYETIERTELQVVKKDGTRQPLNREKLTRGLTKACEKRPVPLNRIDRAVEEILTELHHDHLAEIPSEVIGAKVMDKLHQIDPVAYVRYVSVYREFDDVGEFIAEIQNLSQRAKRDPLQRDLIPVNPNPSSKAR
ncbi:transcriptional regulator NrdR [Roseibacillus ishigakijimensis]|uniref:Transcriptional repressor NrdR n=1 Tax=Roseibacillus ishigakijimensis TaxID=454146 RepID=A0A934RVH5_9BACT|nr:transcriptional regulator NrdR [Roseibacillus ishigakijimensis]MBK1834915.1 transcriptional repressor NrdR [Roseibacillus ishigakijimensis]